MSASPTERPIRSVNVVVLRDGREVHLDDIATAADGQAILDDLDGAILSIEDQIGFDDGSKGTVWRKRADMALRRKRRQRPALQRRIGDLRRAERQAAAHPPPGPGPERRDARRKAFIDAAEEMPPHETFVELWAHAAEREPTVFADAAGGGA
ncbi:MAG: hypothetical protein PGN25_15110 [Methylorubrum populi]